MCNIWSSLKCFADIFRLGSYHFLLAGGHLFVGGGYIRGGVRGAKICIGFKRGSQKFFCVQGGGAEFFFIIISLHKKLWTSLLPINASYTIYLEYICMIWERVMSLTQEGAQTFLHRQMGCKIFSCALREERDRIDECRSLIDNPPDVKNYSSLMNKNTAIDLYFLYFWSLTFVTQGTKHVNIWNREKSPFKKKTFRKHYLVTFRKQNNNGRCPLGLE